MGEAATGYALRGFPHANNTSIKEGNEPGKTLHLSTSAPHPGGVHPRLTSRSAAWLNSTSAPTELFFKALKQNLKIKTFVGTSANAVKTVAGGVKPHKSGGTKWRRNLAAT